VAVACASWPSKAISFLNALYLSVTGVSVVLKRIAWREGRMSGRIDRVTWSNEIPVSFECVGSAYWSTSPFPDWCKGHSQSKVPI
jgi:hypothetical protein